MTRYLHRRFTNLHCPQTVGHTFSTFPSCVSQFETPTSDLVASRCYCSASAKHSSVSSDTGERWLASCHCRARAGYGNMGEAMHVFNMPQSGPWTWRWIFLSLLLLFEVKQCLHTSSCCLEHLCNQCFSVFFSSLCSCQLLAFASLLISFLLCYVLFCSPSPSPSPSLLHSCRMAVICFKVPVASDSQNVIKFQKYSRNASCPLPIFFKALFMQECYFYKSLPFNHPQHPNTHIHTHPNTPLSSFSLQYSEHPLKMHIVKEGVGVKCGSAQQTRNKTEEH